MAKGGYRPGAGRKPGEASIKAEEARAFLAQAVFDEIGPIAKVLIKRAKTGEVQAIKELFDRAFGRAPQFVDITTKGKELPHPILPNVQTDNGDEKDTGA